MQRFLNDYGLIWVGESHEQQLEAFKDEELPARMLWKPGETSASKFQIDFDLILENVKDLNALAGEGLSEIEHTPRGARLRQPQSLPLTLYQDGIVMGKGPFRPYEEPSTQQYLQDIMDGYFPSELQPHYPNGIPLQVTDKRDVVFREKRLPGSFPGPGQVVGHSKSNDIWTHIPPLLTGPKLSLEQFLNKLPKSLIRGGQVIDVRDSIRARLQVPAEVIQLETPQLAAEEAEPPAAGVCTLRIKSESGEQTYIVKMLFTETIGDLRQHLTRARPWSCISDRSIAVEQGSGLVPDARNPLLLWLLLTA
uniref:UBX domain-containing protein 11 n=1 Tax=Nothoprocta perdicaria TaxID=30464 RepID=A0A8C6ZBR6_NOTPE